MTLSATSLAPYFQTFGYPPSNSLVLELQRQLKALGIDPGPADGVLGERTLSALASVGGRTSPGLTAALDAARTGGVQLPGASNASTRDDFADFFARRGSPLSSQERESLSKLFAPTSPATPRTAEQQTLDGQLRAQRASLNAGRPSISLSADGQLLARGSSGNDRIQLERLGQNVRVQISERDTGRSLLSGTFAADQIKGVTVDAGAGDDTIENGFALRGERGVNGARLFGGTGANVIYNNGDGALIQGSQRKAANEGGDIVLNEGRRTQINGSNRPDYIVSNGDRSRVSASSIGDITVATGKDQNLYAGDQGTVVSNGQNQVTASRSRLYSNPILANTLQAEAELAAHQLRTALDAQQPPPAPAPEPVPVQRERRVTTPVVTDVLPPSNIA